MKHLSRLLPSPPAHTHLWAHMDSVHWGCVPSAAMAPPKVLQRSSHFTSWAVLALPLLPGPGLVTDPGSLCFSILPSTLSTSLLLSKHIVPPNLMKMSWISDFSRLQPHNSNFSNTQQTWISSWVPGTGAGTQSFSQCSPFKWLLPSTPSFICYSLVFPLKSSEIVRPLAVRHGACLCAYACSSLHGHYDWLFKPLPLLPKQCITVLKSVSFLTKLLLVYYNQKSGSRCD